MNTCINCDAEIADGMYRCLKCADLVYQGKIGALNKRPQLEEDEAEAQPKSVSFIVKTDEIMIPNGVIVDILPMNPYFSKVRAHLYAYDFTRAEMAIAALERLVADLRYKLHNDCIRRVNEE